MALFQAKTTVLPWPQTLLVTAIALASHTVNAASCSTEITTSTGACSIDAAGQTITITDTGSVLQTSADSAITVNTNAGDSVIRNAGTISNIDNVTTGSPYAIGINLPNDHSGTIINDGTIEADARAGSGGGTAEAYGIQSRTRFDGTLINNGTISANAVSATPGAHVTAEAVRFSQLNGSFTNNGVVRTTTDGSSNVAEGITASQIAGSLTNTGSIDILAKSNRSGSSASANGIQASTLTNTGSISNSGRISVSAISPGSAGAVGINARSTAGTLTNTGSIYATANGSSAYATGISTRTGLSGSLTNSGIIDVQVKSSGSSGQANGIYIRNLTGTFTNTGTIRASATGGGTTSLGANGVFISGNSTGSFTNSGLIEAVKKPNNRAYAVFATGSGTINNTGVLKGAVWSGGDLISSGEHVIQLTGSNTTLSTITGTADYTGGTLSVSGKNGTAITDGQIFNNVISAGTLTISNAQLGTLKDDLLLYSFNAVKDANTIDITANRSSLTSVINKDFAAQGAFIENLILNGGSSPAARAIALQINNASSIAEVNQIINDNLMPALNGGTGQLNKQNVSNVNSIISGRTGGSGLSSGDASLDERFWVKAIINNGSQRSGSTQANYDLEANSTVLGVDTLRIAGARLGGAFSYTHTDVDNHNSADMDIYGYQLSFYGDKQLSESGTAEFILSYGRNNNKIQNGASYNSRSASLYTAYTHNFRINERLSLNPKLSGFYLNLKEDGYRTGIITVDNNTTDSFDMAVSSDVIYQATDELALLARAGYGKTLSDSGNVTYTADGGTAFTVSSNQQSDYVTAGLGLTYRTSETVDVEFNIDHLERGDFENNTISARLNYRF